MFKPLYTITPGILNNIVKIAESKAVIENAYLIPKWEIALRREALIKNAHASTAIEGNPLTLEQVSELALQTDGKKKKGKGQISLTERQMRIIETINKNDHITNKMIRDMFKLSDEGALKEIKKLIKLGVLISEGKGRGVRYVLA